MKRGVIPAKLFNEAYKRLKEAEASRPKEHCSKCGKEVIIMKMHPEAVENMLEAGYDGTCCWPGFDVLDSK